MQSSASPEYQPIVSIGDLVADLIVSIPALPVEAGQHQLAEDIHLEPGGGANFLIAGARLGYPMAAIGALGDDEWGYQVAELIRAEGVELAGVRYEGTTTTVVVLVSQTGDHVFLGKYGHGDKIELTPADVDIIKNCSALYCAGYTLCEARLQELALAAMAMARQHQRPVFFDPGPQMATVPAAVGREVLSMTNTLLLTEAEIPLLAAGSVVDLLKLGPDTVVVRQGPKGCALYTKSDIKPVLESPGYPVIVADTSAAGDSFNAAFVAATRWGWPPADCAKLANAVGAAKVKKLGGGRNVPTVIEVRAVIDEFDINIEL